MLLPNLRLPHYFFAKISAQIGELAASVAIGNLALAIITLFEPIFLYSVMGFSVPQVLLFFAGVYIAYIILIPFGAKIVSRYGYAHAVFFSIPFYIGYWAALFGAQYYPALIFLAPVLFAAQKALFWPAFHGSVSRFAHPGQEAREFSLIYALIHFAQIIGPFIGGWLSTKYGFGAMFLTAAAVFFASAAPLFLSKEVFVVKLYQYKDTLDLYRTYPKRFWGYVGFGEELLVLTVWPIFIYIMIQGYENVGLLISGATLFATLLAIYIGKFTDTHSKENLLKKSAVVYSIVWLVRLVMVGTGAIFVVDVLSRALKNAVFIPLSTLTYERARATHILPYAVFFEQSLSIGKLSAALIGAGVFALTGSFMWLFVLAAVYALLYIELS